MHQSVYKSSKFLLGISGLILLLQLSTSRFTANAQEKVPLTGGGQIAAELENRPFVGTLKAQGDDNPYNDAFTFKDGKFIGEGCLKLGFSPAPYWMRRDADGIHFLAELSSSEHGTMRFEGVFDGAELKGMAKWKKERWYWTLERVYSFNGKPLGTAQ
jgi:hypothetical protein